MNYHCNTELIRYARKLVYGSIHRQPSNILRRYILINKYNACRYQSNVAQSQHDSHHTQHNTNTPIQSNSIPTQSTTSPRPNITTRTSNQSPVLQQANNQSYTPPNNTGSTATPISKPITKPRIRRNLDAIQLTESAANRIKYLLSTQQNAIGIRIGVRSRGCSGLSYTINYVYADSLDLVKSDDKVQQHDITVYIEKKSLFYIVGTIMDYVDTELASEFVFNNPKAKSQCGCGESFTV